jgi:dTDP-4-amino-4,6-dideoxygalactose transaminase
VKARLVAHLEAHGIQTRSYFAGNLLRHPAYANLGRAEEFPNADAVLKRVFWLGAAPFYTEEHFAHIEKTLKEFAG